MTVYVSMEDRVMGGLMSNERGWFFNEDREVEIIINKLIFQCADEKEAEIVYDNAKNRSDMQNIRIHKTDEPPQPQPKQDENTKLYIEYKTKADYPKFYEPGRFARLASERKGDR